MSSVYKAGDRPVDRDGAQGSYSVCSQGSDKETPLGAVGQAEECRGTGCQGENSGRVCTVAKQQAIRDISCGLRLLVEKLDRLGIWKANSSHRWSFRNSFNVEMAAFNQPICGHK